MIYQLELCILWYLHKVENWNFTIALWYWEIPKYICHTIKMLSISETLGGRKLIPGRDIGWGVGVHGHSVTLI